MSAQAQQNAGQQIAQRYEEANKNPRGVSHLRMASGESVQICGAVETSLSAGGKHKASMELHPVGVCIRYQGADGKKVARVVPFAQIQFFDLAE